MGLCKCPKKKVTNLFCFEHRVNVCEYCLVENHPKCVVQSYLQWLQDSDYDPTCRLCGKNLTDDGCGKCVRLQCYDVFHWSCLDEFARQLPSNTAPAGYACPACHTGLFPASNVVSPVVDSLRQFLSTVNWARAGLGLPLIMETEHPPRPPTVNGPTANIPSSVSTGVHSQTAPSQSTAADVTNAHRSSQSQSVISVDETVPYSRGVDRSELLSNIQKLVGGMPDGVDGVNTSHDHDRDKYKRRPALQWLTHWFSSRTSASRPVKDPNAGMKRFSVILLLILIGFITVIIIFTRLGKSVTDDDPFLDPMANPHIRVQEDLVNDA